MSKNYFLQCFPPFILQYIVRLYEQTQDEKLKYNYVKAMGNIGVRETITYLQPYVEGRTHFHKFDRENAIWALRNVGHRYPDKVSHNAKLEHIVQQ